MGQLCNFYIEIWTRNTELLHVHVFCYTIDTLVKVLHDLNLNSRDCFTNVQTAPKASSVELRK